MLSQPDEPALHRAVHRDADLPDRRSGRPRRRSERLRAGPQDRLSGHLDGQLPALDHARHGGRSPLRRHPRLDQWSELNYNAIRGENLVNNGFINEFRLAMANLAANNASAARRAGSFAYFGPGTGTAPLPIYLAYLNGSRDATNPRRIPGHDTAGPTRLDEHHLRRPLVPATRPAQRRRRSRRQRRPRAANAIAAGLPANFFVANPAVDDVNVTDSGAFSDYHALQIELRRRLSKGLSANVNYQYAIEGGSAFDGFTFGRDDGTTRATSATRSRRSGTGRSRSAAASASARHAPDPQRHPRRLELQRRRPHPGAPVNFGNVRLVGMTEKDLQDMYKFDIRPTPDNGCRTVYMLPDDVIHNTRRAFSTSSTTLTGYSASLGAPEGRYIAPANSDGLPPDQRRATARRAS